MSEKSRRSEKPANKAIFLDRDGVINVDHGYVHKRENFKFIDGVFDACRYLQQSGYLLAVITNQSGIARGFFSETEFQALTNWMLEQFRAQKVEITAVYHCPHHPQYGPYHDRHCTCRKPAPGLINRAIAELSIDPATSLMVGDKGTDLQAAIAAKIGGKILVRSGQQNSREDEDIADEIWNSIKDAKTSSLILSKLR